MKVLLVNAGPRKNGNTNTALSEVAKQLEKNGIEAEIVQVGTKPVRSCIACGQCKAKELGCCTFDDDICNSIIEKMKNSDAFIIGSPVYYGGPNGSVCALMDRICYSLNRYMQFKPAASVVVCRRGGASAAFERLNQYFTILNMPIVSSQYWNMVYGQTPGQAQLDEEGMQTMRTLAHNLAWMIRGLRGVDAPEPPAREEWQPMHFIR